MWGKLGIITNIRIMRFFLKNMTAAVTYKVNDKTNTQLHRSLNIHREIPKMTCGIIVHKTLSDRLV